MISDTEPQIAVPPTTEAQPSRTESPAQGTEFQSARVATLHSREEDAERQQRREDALARLGPTAGDD